MTFKHVVVIECDGDPQVVSDALYEIECGAMLSLVEAEGIRNPAITVEGDSNLPRPSSVPEKA